jgi:hypothetical protein
LELICEEIFIFKKNTFIILNKGSYIHQKAARSDNKTFKDKKSIGKINCYDIGMAKRI